MDLPLAIKNTPSVEVDNDGVEKVEYPSQGVVRINHVTDSNGCRFASLVRCGDQVIGVQYNNNTYRVEMDETLFNYLSDAMNPVVKDIVKAKRILTLKQMDEFLNQYIYD